VPFLESGSNFAAVASDPTTQVLTSSTQQPAVATEPGGDPAIVGGIPAINDCM